MMEGNVGTGLRYAALYAIRTVILVVVVVALAWLLLDMFLRTLPGSVPVDTGDILVSAIGYIPVILPMIPMAFVAGYFAPGTKSKLVMRVIMNLFLVAVTLFLTSDLAFSMQNLVLRSGPDVVAETIGLTMDASVAGYLLLLIPICSMIDAVIEYRDGDTG